MARKGQKFNKYSEELKQKVLEEYFKGEGGTKVLGKKYKISFHTIDTWVDMVKYPERHLGTGKKRGRPKDSENQLERKI